MVNLAPFKFFYKMTADIIIGANYGDEGKGTVVATCAKHNCAKNRLNVLTNGGAQRAHSIVTEDGSFTFQHFGSGTYHGADSYFSEYFILNPMQFVNEYMELSDKGAKYNKYRNIGHNWFIFRNINCRWSTPFDMMANAVIEKLRDDNKHGSCGMGIWETTLRYKNTPYTKTFDDFISLPYDERINYLTSIKHYFEKERIGTEIPAEWKFVWNNVNLIEHFIQDCEYMHKHTVCVNNLNDILKDAILDLKHCHQYSNIIFENGQGLLLSDTGKDIAGTTPSLTGCDYAKAIIENSGIDMDVNLHYVTRPYLTRHGRGHLYNESDKTIISGYINEDRTNHYNEFQESFRYGNMTAEVMGRMHDYIMKDASKMEKANVILDVTHCDEVDKVSDFKKLFKTINTYESPLIK